MTTCTPAQSATHQGHTRDEPCTEGTHATGARAACSTSETLIVSTHCAGAGPKERELNEVQERHVAAVYGEGGEAMLAALYDNPSVAVPVVAGRLEAKGAEWRKVPSGIL